MSMADYSKDIASARKDIADAGIMCQLSRDGATFDVPALILKIDPSKVGRSDGSGGLISWTDRTAMLPGGLERNPDPEQDRLIIPPCDIYPNGEDVRIVTATPLAPSGQAILWELLLRK